MLYSGDLARVDIRPVPEKPVMRDAATLAQAKQVDATLYQTQCRKQLQTGSALRMNEAAEQPAAWSYVGIKQW